MHYERIKALSKSRVEKNNIFLTSASRIIFRQLKNNKNKDFFMVCKLYKKQN